MPEVPQTHRIPLSHCPTCGHRHDASTGINHDSIPKAGDFTLCINCGEVMRFDGLMVARVVPWRDWAQHPAAAEIMKARAFVREFRTWRGR